VGAAYRGEPAPWFICYPGKKTGTVLRMSGPPDSNPPAENREGHRRRTLLPGLIFVPQTQWTFECLIRNLSEAGAKIDIQADAPIPSRFMLIDIKNRLAYEVEMVRRRERDVGLKILRSIPLMEASGSEALQLKRLLVDRMAR
jgi:hypothetical protein